MQRENLHGMLYGVAGQGGRGMIEDRIAKDLSKVVESAKLMGCNEVKSFRQIPLKNVETVISALQRYRWKCGIYTLIKLKELEYTY